METNRKCANLKNSKMTPAQTKAAYEKELLSKPLKKFKKNSTQAKSILGKGENI